MVQAGEAHDADFINSTLYCPFSPRGLAWRGGERRLGTSLLSGAPQCRPASPGLSKPPPAAVLVERNSVTHFTGWEIGLGLQKGSGWRCRTRAQVRTELPAPSLADVSDSPRIHSVRGSQSCPFSCLSRLHQICGLQQGQLFLANEAVLWALEKHSNCSLNYPGAD